MTSTGMVSEAVRSDARELMRWVDNDERLYRRLTACQVNLWRKRFSGDYDHGKAPKLYRPLMDDAAREYKRVTGDAMGPGVRALAAQLTADEYRPMELENLALACAYTSHSYGLPSHRVFVFADGETYATQAKLGDLSGDVVAVWCVLHGLRRVDRNGGFKAIA